MMTMMKIPLQGRNICIYLINRNEISPNFAKRLQKPRYKNCVKLDEFARNQ